MLAVKRYLYVNKKNMQRHLGSNFPSGDKGKLQTLCFRQLNFLYI